MLDTCFVTSIVSHTTAAHFLHYSVSNAAFLPPLPLENATKDKQLVVDAAI